LLPTLVSITVGVVVWFLFELVIAQSGLSGGLYYWWGGYLLMLLVSGTLGYFYPQRCWRWGTYMVGAHVAIASLRSPGDHNMLPLELIFFGFLALLYVFASYFGSWIYRRSKRSL
jgi:hypothetical protein